MKTQAERCAAEGHKYEVIKYGLFSRPAIKQCKWCGDKKEYLVHCCGASGFGLGYGDYCPACEAGKKEVR